MATIYSPEISFDLKSVGPQGPWGPPPGGTLIINGLKTRMTVKIPNIKWSRRHNVATITREKLSPGFTASAPGANLKPSVWSPAVRQRKMSPGQWLEANIGHWGVETGLHASLDASRHDDRCRLRNAKPLHLHSMFTRLANSIAANGSRAITSHNTSPPPTFAAPWPPNTAAPPSHWSSTPNRISHLPIPNAALVHKRCITAGYGNEALTPAEQNSIENENGYMSYGPLAARSRNAVIMMFCWHGKGIHRNNAETGYHVGTIPRILNQTLLNVTDSVASWDHSKYIPDFT